MEIFQKIKGFFETEKPSEKKQIKTEELSLKERLFLLSQGKVGLIAIGVGIVLIVIIAWTTIEKARQEMATVKQEVPVPTIPSFKEDSSKVNKKYSHLNSADETIKKKMNDNPVSMDWQKSYEIIDSSPASSNRSEIGQRDSVKIIPTTNKNLTYEERKIADRSKNRKPKQKKDWVLEESKPKARITEPITESIGNEGQTKSANIDDYFNTVKADNKNADSKVQPAKPQVNEHYVTGVVNGNQLIKNGKRVSFRITEATTINGNFVPRNTLVTGLAYLGNNRVTFEIASIKINNQTTPLKLKTLDQDMVEGLAFDGDNPVRNDVRQGTTQAIDDISNEALSYIPYAGIAYAGKSLGRGLSRALSSGTNRKKAQEIMLEDGYKVFFVVKN
ncbi:conjugative transposon protein TraM [Arcicella sp. LKC2W]|uniref:conjugative transposon protein TraM n=1 Tax=Arcicella sp. LKC2W TaxID=2984198 RepID=UPI002B1F1502|nr:conjugative transposon protein TraM [Arcicella sp. LKC2W]MEA5462001.1 conjugative transposon protein TraM [Arcicella sp. LKC2W]